MIYPTISHLDQQVGFLVGNVTVDKPTKDVSLNRLLGISTEENFKY